MRLGAEDTRELTNVGRRRLVGDGGVVAEHQGVHAHPRDSSSQLEAALGGAATCADGHDCVHLPRRALVAASDGGVREVRHCKGKEVEIVTASSDERGGTEEEE